MPTPGAHRDIVVLLFKHLPVLIFVAACIAVTRNAEAGQVRPIDDLRNEVERLRRDLQEKGTAHPIRAVENNVHKHTFSTKHAATRAGSLTISGLVQVWYQAVANDGDGVVRNPAVGDFSESNKGNDNDTFRVRRAEIGFDLEIHQHVRAFLSIDPAREHAPDFYPLPTFAVHNRVSGSEGRLSGALNTFSDLQPAKVLVAGSVLPRLLQDAYIQYRGVVPHHDFTIGQFLPPAGEEAWRKNDELDFVERSMLSYQDRLRDLGAMIQGNWWNERFQYWVGVFNGPDGSVLNDVDIVSGGNRSDDNDDKNIAWRVLLRPYWNSQKVGGGLELGFARTDGWVGEGGQAFDETAPTNSSNIKRTSIHKQSAWASWQPGAALRGAWLRGEWGSSRGRFSAFFGRTNLLGTGADASNNDEGVTVVRGQLDPAPITVSGWSASAGYRFGASRWATSLRQGNFAARMLADSEFAMRYEEFENIAMEDLVDPDRKTDLFKTRVVTAGVNYNLRGTQARVQANYIWVDEASDRNPDRGLREVRNDVFVLNFQVGF